MIGAKRFKVSCSSCPMEHLTPGGCPFSTRGYAKGIRLFEQGEVAHTLWFVKSGAVTLERNVEWSASPVAWKLVLPGALVGVETVTMPRYECTAVTATASRICRVARSQLQPYLIGGAAVLLAPLAHQWLEMAPSPRQSAVARVAEWIRAMARYDLPSMLPRQVIAELLVMTPETLSRALKQLTEMRAIRSTRRRIDIADVGALNAAVVDGAKPVIDENRPRS